MEKFAAIPTLYNGVQYRSRLEAKWAVMFDLFGWKAEYEPFDLNGWIPDFEIEGKRGNLLVEVKPFISQEEFQKDIDDILNLFPDRSQEVLFLGRKAFSSPVSDNSPQIGWFAEGVRGEDLDRSYWVQEAVIGRYYPNWDNIGVCPAYGDYTDRITGAYDGNPASMEDDELIRLWRQAGNIVQWKSFLQQMNYEMVSS